MKGIELINASAGSGKTYGLTNRVLEKLQREVAPEGLMATTFTNKAAAELRERIRLQLLKHDKPNEAQRIFDGFVGTVNSICARLLQEYALDAGLSPALDVLPETDGSRLFKIAIASVINQHADELEPAAQRLSLVSGGTKYRKPNDWPGDVQRVVELARTNQLDGDALRECAQHSWTSLLDLFGNSHSTDISKKLDIAVQVAISELEQIVDPKQKTQGSLSALKNFARSRQQGVKLPWVEWVRISKLETNKDGESLLDEVKRIAGEVFKHPGFQADVQQIIMGVFDCAAEALQSYASFKQEQGLMDFVDQETLVLDLARNNAAFRASIKDRLHQIMVDEFQDTSPIQLALFLELNQLAGQSVWVGDPKQAIYGFRDTDPQLMEEVTKLISNTSTLDQSWRSCETLVQFCNETFSKVFHEMGKDKVCLNIPDERRETAKGGWIESWNLPAKNNPDEYRALAYGVKDLLKTREDIKPGDIAILCRKNNQCRDIAESLEAQGIRASVAQGALLETRECQLAMAALRYMQNRRDTVALAEVVHLSPLHGDHGQWLESLVTEKDCVTARWMNDPLIVGLDQARDDLKCLTPLEALEHAINKVELLRTLNSWSNAPMRMSNLDMLRSLCEEYLDQCRSRRSAATVTGFIAYLQDAQPGQAEGSGDQTVQVLTYHRAKGLEWPIVVLAGLNNASKARVFGANAIAAPVFDPADPLAHRSIRYWPWPFDTQENIPELDNKLIARDEAIIARELALKESRRLMYVGMTRAREGMVFAIRKHETKKDTYLETAWLDELADASGQPLLIWPLETGEQSLNVGDCSVPVRVREFSAEAGGAEMRVLEDDNYLAPIKKELPEYPPARITPSSIAIEDDDLLNVEVRTVADFGRRIEIKGEPDMASLGNAVHGFLGIDLSELAKTQQEDIAAGLLQRWGVGQAISPADLLAASEQLLSFIEENYPEAKILREWPITLRNQENQLTQGWVDMLLELSEGYIVIDHKSYSGADVQEHAKQYAPQLFVYREGVEKATGKKVIATLQYMPVAGLVLSLSKV